jgi:hypothetical protein
VPYHPIQLAISCYSDKHQQQHLISFMDGREEVIKLRDYFSERVSGASRTMSTTSREEQSMSITEKLAHGNHRAEKLLRAGVPFFVVKASEPYARQVVALIKANEGTNWTAECEAWAESVLSAPAVEVSADAVEVALNGKMPTTGAKVRVYISRCVDFSEHDIMQAALAAAFPVLVQQVERLKAEVERTRRSVLSEELHALRTERDTLSAANAELRGQLRAWETNYANKV